MAKPIVGIVSSTKNDKTIVVTVHSRKTHPLYRKQYTISRKFMAHDAKNEAETGDKVAIVETRPLSARKRHVLQRVIEKPVLRADSLAITKADEPAKPASKSKAKPADEPEVEPKAKEAKS